MRPLAFVLCASLLVVGERAANACSAACPPTWSAPASGQAIPTNAPALVLSYPPKTGEVRLTTSGGTEIPFTIEGSLLRPTMPFPVGSLTVEYDDLCGGMSPDAALAKATTTFVVVAEKPLPTKLGTATAVVAPGNATIVTSSGECVTGVDASIAELTITLDPSVEPYRSVLAIETRVDGTGWGHALHGRNAPHAYTSSLAAGMAAGLHRHDTVFAACGASSGADRGVSPGKHKIEVIGKIAGAPALPPLAIDVEFTCPPAPPADAGADADSDAGPDAGPTPSAQSSGDGGGCSHGGTSSGALAALLFVGLAAALRRLDTTRRSR